MMRYLSKNVSVLVSGLVLTVVYFLSRFYQLLSLPIFTDEAIYTRWMQIAKNDAAWRFISLTDGKQPLFIWLSMELLPHVSDPLLAGRIVSVLSGFATAVGLFFLGALLFRNKWIGMLSSLIYVVYPFGLVYDRMALYDSLVGTFAVWGLVMVLVTVRKLRLDMAIMLGVVAGLGALNKTSGFFSVGLYPLSILLLDWKKKGRNRRLLYWIGLGFVAGVVMMAMYSILRLSPFYYIIGQKNDIFVYPLREWLQHPFTYFWGNFWIGQRDWLVTYMGYPFLILVVAAFFLKREYLREKIVLGLWFGVPFIYLAFFGRTLYPRYILFMTLSLLPLIAYSFYQLLFVFNKRLIGVVLIYLFLLLPIYSDYMVLTDFSRAPIPLSDRNQYYNDWPSGDGVKETIMYLHSHLQGKKAVLYTQGTFGLLPYAYEIYANDIPTVSIKGLWPIEQHMPRELIESAKKLPTYIVFYQPCPDCPTKGTAPITWKLRSVYHKQKHATDTSITLYQVLPE